MILPTVAITGMQRGIINDGAGAVARSLSRQSESATRANIIKVSVVLRCKRDWNGRAIVDTRVRRPATIVAITGTCWELV